MSKNTLQSRLSRGGAAIFVALSAFLLLMSVMSATEIEREIEMEREIEREIEREMEVEAASATITVNSTADVVADDGRCTLREAITAANRDTASGLSGGECAAGSGDDTIVLSAESYTLSLSGTNEELNATGDLDVTSDITIEVTSGVATIDGNQLDRVLHVHPDAALTMERVIITGGKSADGASGAAGEDGGHADHGGGVYNAGVLTMSDSTIRNNRTGEGGNGGNAATSNGGTGGPGGFGGGIYNSGTLILSHHLMQENRTGFGGGGGEGGSSGHGGEGGHDGHGGAIYNAESGQLTLIYSTIERNSTGNSGNNALTRRGTNGGRGGDGGHGGGIYNEGALMIDGSAISHNRTSSGGAGGSGTSGGDGGNAGHGGALYHMGNGSFTLTDVSFNDNITGNGGQGGASQSKGGFGGNGGFGGYGAALYHIGTGSLTLLKSTIQGNITGNGGGGGVSPTSGNGGTGGYGGNGGGIYQIGNGTLMMSNSTVSGNQTGNGGNGGNENNSQGGNAGNGGGIASTNRVTITHNTITANITGVGGNNNGANGSGGGIFGGATLKNTIVAGNQSSGNSPDCLGTFTSLGYNLLQEISNCTITGHTSSNITDTAPLLAPLANNGGSTLTHALLLGSPALDAGSCNDLSSDQRGEPRPIDLPSKSNRDDGCDIGAYERQHDAFQLTKSVNNSTPNAGEAITYTITIMGFSNSNSAIISDSLPAGLTFLGPITLDPPQAQASLTESPKSLPTLASNITISEGEQLRLTFPVTVNNNLPAGTLISNIASVYSNDYPTQNKGNVSITVNSALTQQIYLPLLIRND